MPTKNTHILILDDEENIGRSLKIWLESEGFMSTYVPTLEEALQKIKDNQFHVALVDLRMKSIDGIYASEKLKEVDKYLQPIIITGFPSYETAVKAMKSGVHDYLSKGASNQEILDSIRNALIKRSEILQSDGEKSFRVKFVLLCENQIVRETLTLLAQVSSKIELLGVFDSLNELKISDVVEKTDIVLIGEGCLPASSEEKDAFFYELFQTFPSKKSILINENMKDDMKSLLLRRGIKGFFPMYQTGKKLEEALLHVNNGEIWANRKLMSSTFENFLSLNPETQAFKEQNNPFGLTKREKEILQVMTKGMKNKEIANHLIISELTVKTHINKILKKLSVDNRTKAIMKAQKYGFK
ncbi:MAG: response regulator [Candidatus Aminicenantes bacterium]|nr:response regulator [Candidatus Aminicenantes bacterium]